MRGCGSVQGPGQHDSRWCAVEFTVKSPVGDMVFKGPGGQGAALRRAVTTGTGGSDAPIPRRDSTRRGQSSGGWSSRVS